MRNNFKKIAALVMVLVMLVSTFVPAFAATTCPGAGKTHTAANCEYTIVGTKDATCTEAGYETGRCSTCNTQFTVSAAPAVGHNWSEGKGDCTTGVTKTCTVCGLKESVTAADGHNWSAWKLADDACDIGVQASRACSVCGQKQSKVMTEKHNWELVEYTAPASCVAAGSASYKCTSENCTATKTEAIYVNSNPNTTGDGHDWKYLGYNYQLDVLVNGVAQKLTTTQKVTSDITLTTGVVITKEIFNAYFDKYVPFSCLTGATEPKVCNKCGTWVMDSIAAIPAGAASNPNRSRSHDFSVDVAAVAPTCTEAGTVAYKACSKGCGTYLYNTTQYLAAPVQNGSDWTASVVAEKTGDQYMAITHKLSDLTISAQHWNHVDAAYSVDATCTAAGKKAYYCVLCGNANNKSYEVTAPLGHQYYTDLSADKQAEKMQKAIQEAAVLYLTGATPSVTNFAAYVNAAIERTIVNPTCVAAGSTTYGCLRCADTSAVKVEAGAAATGHVASTIPGAGSVAPTCTANGVYVYWCKNNCGTTLSSEPVDALGHNMTNKVIITPATCQTEGKYIATCARGCEYGVKDVATAGYVEVVSGQFVHADLCENFVAIPKAHTWVERNADGSAGNAIVVTCADTDAASRTYNRVCTTCNIFELGVVYDAVAHVHYDFDTAYALGLTVQAVIGTCTTQGVYYINCAGGCGLAPVKYVDPYTGNGHNDLVLIEGVAASCKSENNKAWTEASYCLVCGNVNTLKFLNNNHEDDNGVLYGFDDILINKNGIDIYAWDVANRKLGTKYTTVAEVTSADAQKLVVAVKRGAKIVNGVPADAADYVAEVAITDTIKWVFYVPGTCAAKGTYGGIVCTLCNNADCKDGVSAFAVKYTGAKNDGDVGHNRTLVATVAMTCQQYGFARYECAFCKDSVQVGYTASVHSFVKTEDDTAVSANCELDGWYTMTCVACGTTESYVEEAWGHKNQLNLEIVNSCIDRTGDRYCVLCASYIPMDHRFGEWTETADAKTRECADCAFVEVVAIETEPVETEPVETEPVVTDPVETEPAETTPVETAPVETTPVETEPADEKGCGSSIAAIAVALVATLGTCVVFAGKKRD